jgi:glycosyltransferase involved in cell wall biosynthesis
MKILYFITKANFGGAQKYVFDLASSAQEAGHAPVLVYGVPGKLSLMCKERGIRTIQLSGLQRDLEPSGELSAFFQLFRILKEECPDVIHVNSSKGGLALLAARIRGIKKILFTAHGWAFNEDRSHLQKKLLRFIYTITILLSHATICVSEAVRRDIEIPLIRNKLRVIRNGIEGASLLSRDDARHAFKSDAGGIWIGMTAELHKTKCIGDAIRALARLRDKFPTLSLTVMGEGEEREKLEALIQELSLEEKVFLPGFTADAPRLLGAFDLFLMPSRTEALGYAAIEAGYAGLPVIASNVGGLPEVIEHEKTGLLVPAENPSALADAIDTLLSNKERAKQYGIALKAHVEKEFSKEIMVRETFALYGA